MSQPPKTGALAPVKAFEQDFGWRNTPKINFAPQRKPLPISPLDAALIATLLIVALLAYWMYDGLLQNARQDVETRTREVETVQQAISAKESQTRQAADRVATKTAENQRIQEQDAVVNEVYDQFTGKRPQWHAALQQLLLAESEGFQLVSVEAQGSPAQFRIQANSEDSQAEAAFITRLRATDVLELSGFKALDGDQRTGNYSGTVSLK